MVAYAEHQFNLSKPRKDGTLRDHLEQVAKQIGRRPKELDGPEFPSLMSHVWSAFLCLNNSRSMGASSANPINYQEIKAFMETTHTRLSARDVETIKTLDQVYLRIMNSDG